MTDAARLQRLAEMQKLRERKSQSAVGAAMRDEHEKSGEVARLAYEQRAAAEQCDATMRSAQLCPDQMLLASGFLSVAQAALTLGEQALEAARAHHGEMRQEWQDARHRTDNIAMQARRVRRKDDRRRDDARLAERLSLRAALSGGTKP